MKTSLRRILFRLYQWLKNRGRLNDVQKRYLDQVTFDFKDKQMQKEFVDSRNKVISSWLFYYILILAFFQNCFQAFYEFYPDKTLSQASAFNRTHWDFWIHMICDFFCYIIALAHKYKPEYFGSWLGCGWWTFICIYHYFTVYFEKYTINQIRLLMGDLTQYASVLILVLGSRRWFTESVFLMISYIILVYLMAKNATENAFDVCTEHFDLS